MTDETGQMPAESMLTDDQLSRAGAVAAVLGIVIVLLERTTELVQPIGRPENTPEDAVTSFADYAALDHRVAPHLIEFLAFAFVFGFLVEDHGSL